MSVVKVIEIIAEGNSIENAVENGLSRASKTIHEIKSVYVQDIKAMTSNNQVSSYRLVLKVSFVLQS